MGSSKLPKLFSIYVSDGNKDGYIRFRSYKTENEIRYKCTVVDNIKDASKYINFDNVKKEAALYYGKYGFVDISVVDVKTLKFHHVKIHK